MIEMIEHFANRGDYMALFFMAAVVLRVVVLVWQMTRKDT